MSEVQHLRLKVPLFLTRKAETGTIEWDIFGVSQDMVKSPGDLGLLLTQFFEDERYATQEEDELFACWLKLDVNVDIDKLIASIVGVCHEPCQLEKEPEE